MNLLNQFDEFIKNLNQEDKIGVIFHADTDGICSAVITAIAIERLLKKKITIFHTQGHSQIAVEKELVAYLEERAVTKAIFVDLAIDQNPEFFLELEQHMDCLVLDHHKLYNNLNSDNTVHIKPQMINPEVDGSKYCCSKMCFDYFSRLVNISDLDWIAAIGVIGDFNEEPWHKFLDQVCRKYNLDCQDMLKSKLGKAAWVIDAGEAVVPSKTAEALKILYTARNVDDVLNSELAQLSSEIQKEVASFVHDFDGYAEIKGDVAFFEINSRFKIKSEISNGISRLHPNMTIFVYTKPNQYGYINISGRRQDFQVDVGKILEQAVKDLEGASGGGHKPAAAATVRKQDFPEFKRRILELLGKI